MPPPAAVDAAALEPHGFGSDQAQAGRVHRLRLRRNCASLSDVRCRVDTKPAALLAKSGPAAFASCNPLSNISARYVHLGNGRPDDLVPAAEVASLRTVILHAVLGRAGGLHRFLVYFSQANPRRSGPDIHERCGSDRSHVLALAQAQFADVTARRSNKRRSGPAAILSCGCARRCCSCSPALSTNLWNSSGRDGVPVLVLYGYRLALRHVPRADG